MIVKKEIQFDADKATVWDLLTNPSLTQQYMFGCQVLSDWKVGSPIIWEGKTEDGTAIIYVKGTITSIEKGQEVSFTMFDPNMGIEDIPENYINLTYQLQENDQGTQLTLIQGDFSKVANGQQRYEETEKGWEMVISLMKDVLKQIS